MVFMADRWGATHGCEAAEATGRPVLEAVVLDINARSVDGGGARELRTVAAEKMLGASVLQPSPAEAMQPYCSSTVPGLPGPMRWYPPRIFSRSGSAAAEIAASERARAGNKPELAAWLGIAAEGRCERSEPPWRIFAFQRLSAPAAGNPRALAPGLVQRTPDSPEYAKKICSFIFQT